MKMLSRLASRAARAYIAGPGLDDACRVCALVAGRGFNSTIGFWNGGETSEQIAGQYLAALEKDALRGEECFLSVKAPALGFDIPLFAEIARAARRRGTPLHFDSLGPETVDPTFRIIERLLPNQGRFGCTLPGRWRRSLLDGDRAVRLGLRVRVVKGQWPDHSGSDPASGFLAVVERLAGRAVHVGIATHDPTLARECLARLVRAGTGCELELLWGLPSAELVRVARELQVPARFYVPYGCAWLPYALSQATRRPRMFMWFLHDVLLGRRTPESLRPEGSRGGSRVPFM